MHSCGPWRRRRRGAAAHVLRAGAAPGQSPQQWPEPHSALGRCTPAALYACEESRVRRPRVVSRERCARRTCAVSTAAAEAAVTCRRGAERGRSPSAQRKKKEPGRGLPSSGVFLSSVFSLLLASCFDVTLSFSALSTCSITGAPGYTPVTTQVRFWGGAPVRPNEFMSHPTHSARVPGRVPSRGRLEQASMKNMSTPVRGARRVLQRRTRVLPSPALCRGPLMRPDYGRGHYLRANGDPPPSSPPPSPPGQRPRYRGCHLGGGP